MTNLNAIASIPKKHFLIMLTLVLLVIGTKAFAVSDIVYIASNQNTVYGTGAAVNGSTLGIQVNNFGGAITPAEPVRGVARKFNVGVKPTVTTLTVGENDSATKYVSVDPGVYQAVAEKPSIYPYVNQASGRVAIW